MSEDQVSVSRPKIRAIYNLLKQAPPGQFKNLFNDVRFLLNDDNLLFEETKMLCAINNLDNFTPVLTEGHKVLLTHHNDLGNCRYLDPQKRVTFLFNHLSREISDFQPLPEGNEEAEQNELWRSAFQKTLNNYTKSNFASGVCNVYRNTISGKETIVACIEAHKYHPCSFWNGLWRSEWTFTITFPVTHVSGHIMVEVHYYENGNVHLSATQSIEETLHLNNKEEAAKELAAIVEKADSKFQASLMEEYRSLSDISVKTVRRQLPITRSILDWNKLLTSSILKTNIASRVYSHFNGK